MLAHDDPRFVPGDNDRAAHARHIARNIPNQFGYRAPAARQSVNLTGAPSQAVRTMGPHKTELIKLVKPTTRWYVVTRPYGKARKNAESVWSEPFRTEKAAVLHANRLLNLRQAFRAEVVKG